MRRALLVLGHALVVALAQECVDSNEHCAGWASAGECFRNPGYMSVTCRKSCLRECGATPAKLPEDAAGGAAPPQRQGEEWEHENLELAREDTAVHDTSGDELLELAAKGRPVLTWFYAPWCKQCKIARPGFEALAKTDNREQRFNFAYARLDCVRYPDAKKHYGINSYPAFKVLRGTRHRWMEIGRNRSEEALTKALAPEIDGPFRWMSTVDELRAALYEQVADPTAHFMDRVGQGEALAVAHLPDGADAARALERYTNLTAGCSARHSPLPFVAVRDGSLLTSLDLPAIPAGHVAVVQLFAEPSDAPLSEQTVPRLVSRPLLAPDGSGAADAADEEAALCGWALGHRLPMLLNFDEDPTWGKRAANLGFVAMHALLFLSPPHRELAGIVRAAAARFARGSVLVMMFMVEDMNTGSNAMLPRYGVNSILDTPRLVFLDQRKPDGVNRQMPYSGTIDEEGVAGFLREAGLDELDVPAHDAAPTKDEL